MRDCTQKIRNSFLVVLSGKSFQDITMSEIAKVSNISRSTLYTHYPNTMEIFIGCVQDFLKDVRSLNAQIRCNRCVIAAQDPQCRDNATHTKRGAGGPKMHLSESLPQNEEKLPLCIAIRDAGMYSALVKDPNFLPVLLDLIERSDSFKNDRMRNIEGLSEQQLSALLRFQISGCYSAALSIDKDSDYSEVIKAIDTFIDGGTRALRSSR